MPSVRRPSEWLLNALYGGISGLVGAAVWDRYGILAAVLAGALVGVVIAAVVVLIQKRRGGPGQGR